ncbi:MAG: DUF58 domain-containing protein [Alphaproteobacteria bacterium]
MPTASTILNLRHDAEHAISAIPDLFLAAEKISAHIMHGTHAQRKSGTGEHFWQFRDYQETDSPQNIDWRQSAKSDHVYIRQRERQNSRKTYLWCATGKSMAFSSHPKRQTKQYTAQVMTLALSLLLQQGEEHIGLYGDIKTGRGEDRINKIIHRLGEETDRDAVLPDSESFSLPVHASLISIGDYLSPIEEIEYSFSNIARSEGKSLIIQVLDPAELDLHSLKGRILFEGHSENESELINNVSSVQDEYKKRMHDHIEKIRSLCLAHNWHYVLHCTDTPIENTIKHIWTMAHEQRGSV